MLPGWTVPVTHCSTGRVALSLKQGLKAFDNIPAFGWVGKSGLCGHNVVEWLNIRLLSRGREMMPHWVLTILQLKSLHSKENPTPLELCSLGQRAPAAPASHVQLQQNTVFCFLLFWLKEPSCGWGHGGSGSEQFSVNSVCEQKVVILLLWE